MSSSATASNPQLLPAEEADLPFDKIVTPTDDEVIEQLKKPSVFGTLPKKREFIVTRLLPLRSHILQMMAAVSPTLVETFETNLPSDEKSIRKNVLAKDLAAKWFVISKCLQTFYGACTSSSKRITRADDEFMKESFLPVLETLRNAVDESVAQVNSERRDRARRAMVKLTPTERNRRYLKNGATVPDDEKLRLCAVCGCRNTVDEPFENKEKRQQNKEMLENYYREKAKYNAQKNGGGGNARIGAKGKEVQRAPPCPTMHRTPIVCHCFQFRNPQPSNPDCAGSTCIIKCRDEKGNPYPVKPNGDPTCPVCICPCSAAYEASAYADLMVCRIVGREDVQTQRRTAAKRSVDRISSLLSNAGQSAFEFAARTAKENGIILSEDDIEKDMYERASLDMVTAFASDVDNVSFLQQLRKDGRMATVVNPGNGNPIDTKVFGSSRTEHRARNNKLIVDVDASPPIRPSLFPCGKPQQQSTFITPVAKRKSVYPPLHRPSKSTSKSLFKNEKVSTIDLSVSMMDRVKKRAFKKAGVLNNITNIETGKTVVEPNAKAISQFNALSENSELASDIVDQSLNEYPMLTSPECLDIVNEFLDSKN